MTKLSYEECLARSDIHAVIICTEPHTHENLIRQVLKSPIGLWYLQKIKCPVNYSVLIRYFLLLKFECTRALPLLAITNTVDQKGVWLRKLSSHHLLHPVTSLILNLNHKTLQDSSLIITDAKNLKYPYHLVYSL